MAKKALFLTQLLPYPPDNGGKIKTLATLKLLKDLGYQVYLGGFVDKKAHLKYQAELNKACYRVKGIYHPVVTQNHRQVKWKGFLSLFSAKPFGVYKYGNPELSQWVKRLSSRDNFDMVYIDHLHLSQYLAVLETKPKGLVYDEHNVSSLAVWRNFLIEQNPFTKVMYLLEAAKWWVYERSELAKFDTVLAISKSDRQRLIKLGVSSKKVKFLPTPIKVQPIYRFRLRGLSILFVGLLSWKPNADGVWWFYQKVFPLIQQKLPQASLTVVGANPPQKLQTAGDKDRALQVLGYVANLKKQLKRAGVFIVPIRSAGGVRIKILTGLAHGIPVVSTRLGLEGIDARAGRELMVADDKEGFAKAVFKALTNQALAKKLSKNGLKLIASQYNETKAKAILKECL